MQRKQILYLLAVAALIVSMLPPSVAAQDTAPLSPALIEVAQPQAEGDAGKPTGAGYTPEAVYSPTGLGFVYESEPNGTPGTANALPGAQAVAYGNIWPNGDLDYFSFSGNAGDRVYAATMTAFAAGTTDTTLTLFASDGTTVIEVDVNDGSFAASASSIAGATLPASGAYYLQVKATLAASSMRPYHLYLKVQSGAPTAETEPNNLSDGGQPLPVSGWVSGAIDPAADNDVFTMSLNAGDTVYLGLDLDPERDGGASWNGRLGLGAFGNPPLILVVNDANTTSPNSEAFFFTVKDAGTYYAYVDHPTAAGTPASTYHLSVAVFPHVPATAACTTYTSTNVPLVIPTGPALVQSTLTVPGNPLIADIDVTITLTHTNMPDLDVVLQAPGGNQVVLFNDLGSSGQQQMNLTLDDEAAIPMGSYTAMSSMVYQPSAARRLDWFDYQNAGGTWTLQVYDDLAANGGVLQSWSLTICEPPPPPSCPVGYEPVTVFSTDFEANNGGFTSAGVQNEWQWGAPNFAPITTCNSGANCWVTDLTGTYNASSNQDLFSPAINLSGYSGPVIMRWAQKHQIENANWDNAFVDVRLAGGGSPQRLWEWLGPTMSTTTVGAAPASASILQSAGWSQRWADISAYAGQTVEAHFNLSSDSSINYAGLAVDDVTITACREVQEPGISLAKTVGTDPTVCATTDNITVAAGTDVTYCYEVTNTGDVTLNLHTLDDSELGNLLSGFPYALAPGASAFLTETTTINVTTVNTATWTAYNTGGPSVQATDVATVTVEGPSPLICNPEPITIPSSGAASPYPSNITVAGQLTSLTDVNVHLYGMNHTWPDDIDIMVVGPQGQNLIIMSDAGGSFDLVNVDLVFDDAAATQLPDSAQITSGTYRPSNFGTGDPFPPPAPPPSTATQLATFNGTNPNGTWSLYVVDDTGGDSGNISGGWCVEISAETAQDPPNIDVSPLSLSATQPPNTTTSQALTVANTGDLNLVWQIAEEPASVLAQSNVAGPALPSAALADTGSRGAPSGGPAPLAYTSPADFSQGFDDITVLPGQGWFFQNNSSPLGLTNWFQGNSSVFPAHAGAANAYIGANFNNTSGAGTISNWMLTPVLNLANGDTLSFWTRTPAGSIWPDRLELRLSLAGASTNVGTLATDVGDFTTLLLSVNPTLVQGGYPEVWTQYTATLVGIPPGATGRFGFRYFVTNGGPSGANSNYIGIDTVEYVSAGEPGVCDAPANVPWLSVSPTNGTTAGGGSTPVTVTFNSTGLAPATYNANLCVTSNDPDPGPGNGTDLVIVPVELVVTEPPQAAIVITKTVGTVAGVCASTSSITVPAGTTVYYCYTVTNTGGVTLNLHDLTDDVLGTIFSGLNYALTPGSSVNTVQAGLSIPYVANATTTNTGTWTAYNTGGPSAQAQATATVTVAATGPAINLNKTVGTTPGVCATTDSVTVTAGTQVYYCYVVENTGNVTFNFHDLVDSQLGTILNDLPYVLAPGAFSPQVIVPATPMASVTNVGTWTAMTALGDYLVDDTIPFNWQDISATGAPLTLGDDQVSSALPIGFPFEFYGTAYNNIYVSSNGFLTVLSGQPNGCCTGGILPSTTTPNGVIAGWWEDLNPSAGGAIHYQTLGAAPNRVFIVQFTNIPHFGGGNLVTMQWKLFETSNTIEVHYQAAPSDGGTHSAGIENATGTVGIQYYRGASALPTPLAVRYYLATAQSATDTDTATVTVLTPNIDVNPLSLSESHNTPPQVTTKPLTITNTGQGDLVWNIAEEPTAVQPEPLSGGDEAVAAEVVDPSDFKAPEQASAPAPLTDWRSPQAVLYNNGPLVTHPGAGAGGANVSALQTALGLSTFGFGNQLSAGNRVADDFTVTGGGWFINTITFFAYQTGSTTTSTINHINLRIWNGIPGQAGSSVVFGDTTTNRLASTTWSNIYRTLDTSLGATDRPIMTVVAAINTFLPAGTYWVDWQVGGTLTSGPWAPPVSILGQLGKPGANAWQFTSTGWAPVVDTGAASPQDFPFIVDGLADCSNLVDVPWLSVSPTNGINTGGASTVGTVTFNSTGLANGVYTANLCVFSNDPNTGPGNGTSLVIVPVTLVVGEPTAVKLGGLSATPALPAGLPLAALPALVSLALGAAYALRRRQD